MMTWLALEKAGFALIARTAHSQIADLENNDYERGKLCRMDTDEILTT
jgi:hypothetical protein